MPIPFLFDLYHLKRDGIPEEVRRDIVSGFAKPAHFGQLERVLSVFSLPEQPDGEVNTGLEAVFHLTQNVDESWVKQARESFDVGFVFADHDVKSLRSTSVGDVIHDLHHDKFYLVSGIGFEEITLRPDPGSKASDNVDDYLPRLQDEVHTSNF